MKNEKWGEWKDSIPGQKCLWVQVEGIQMKTERGGEGEVSGKKTKGYCTGKNNGGSETKVGSNRSMDKQGVKGKVKSKKVNQGEKRNDKKFGGIYNEAFEGKHRRKEK